MVQAAWERALTASQLDSLFEAHATGQYTRELLFSTVVDLLAQVVCGVNKSVHAAFQAAEEPIPVSLTSVYNKLNGVEPPVAAELVRHCANQLGPVVDQLGGALPPWVKGHQVRILDGNHLPATERRLAETRQQSAGPLPGLAPVVLDPTRRMVTDVFRCEDAHAQERGLLDSVVATLQERDLGLADRNFCTRAVLLAIVASKACFVIREHANLGWEPAGRVRSRGRVDGARVREQRVAIRDDQDNKVFLRRVALELDEPTRDGDVCIFVLTNLPEEAAGAREVGRLYRQRWTIETTFAEVRSYLGMGTTRGGCQKAVLRAEPRLRGLYGVVTLLYEQLPDEARAVPGVEWDGKETVTFSDAITAVRRWLWASWAFAKAGHEDVVAKLPAPVRRTLLYALAPAA